MGDQSDKNTSAPKHDEILAALETLSATDRLRRSHSLRKLLTYVVSRTLSGDERHLKAYTIAVEALGRSASFDPTSDPIVRVEARRLRKILDDYYRGDGEAAPVRIELAKGRYVPSFVYRNGAASDLSIVVTRPEPMLVPNGAPRVHLVFARHAELDPPQALLADKVETGVTDAITRFSFVHWTNPPCEAAAALPADFRVNLHFETTGPGGELICRYQVWETIDRTVICQDETPLVDVRGLERLLGRLCARVFGESGCLHRHNLALMLSGKQFEPRYECKLRYIDVVRSHGDQGRENAVRLMIEAQLQWDFGFAHGYAFLSYLLFRQAVDAPPSQYDDLMLRALHLALRATELSHDSAFAYTNLYRIADLRGDHAIAKAALTSALRLNPYDDDVKLVHGSRLICDGHPAFGVELMEPRLSVEIPHPTYYLLAVGLGKFLIGDVQGMLDYGLRVPVDVRTGAQSVPGALMVSMMKGELTNDADLTAAAAAGLLQTLSRAGGDMSTFLRRVITHEPSRLAIEHAFYHALARANDGQAVR